MRQAGILAAAGLIALEEMPNRLAEDHENAWLLADALASCSKVSVEMSTIQTNIVRFTLKDGLETVGLNTSLRARGVLISVVGPRAVRLVTHHDVDRAACQRAAEILLEELR
jgi:threonine aldolase